MSLKAYHEDRHPNEKLPYYIADEKRVCAAYETEPELQEGWKQLSPDTEMPTIICLSEEAKKQRGEI